ncbi:MAG: transglutaminase-like domain-containing protein [bacterium]
MKVLILKLLFPLFVFGFVFSQCTKENEQSPKPEPELPPTTTSDVSKVMLTADSCVMLPVGNLLKTGSSVTIQINDSIVDYDLVDDGLGGFWIVIPSDSFISGRTSSLKIIYTKVDASQIIETCTNDSTRAYLKSSKLINWDNSTIINKAKSITSTNNTIDENVEIISNFVSSHLSFNSQYAEFYGGFTALDTYIDKKGVCINFSRLFVAMCRSIGIQSRTVSGVFYDPNQPNRYFGHHQWSEYLDQNNTWQRVDLVTSPISNITDVNYIGLSYCAEETELFSDYYGPCP